MRTTFAAASVLMCLAVVSCKKEPPKEEAPAAPSANPAPIHPDKDKGNKDKDAGGEKPTPGAKGHHGRGTKLAFGERPPKPEKMKAPQVPELPALAAQEKSVPPAKLPVGEYACGASHSGENDYPLMCLDDKSHDKNEKLAKLLVPFAHLKDKMGPLPKVVDHREDKTEAEVRNQGSAGTCTAFGTSAAIDHYVSMWTGEPSHVSTMELWGKYHHPDLGDALIAMVGQTLGSEEAWPYNAKEAWEWRSCGKGEKSGGPCGKAVDKAKLGELEKKPVVVIEQVQWLPKDFELIRHKDRRGPRSGLRRQGPPSLQAGRQGRLALHPRLQGSLGRPRDGARRVLHRRQGGQLLPAPQQLGPQLGRQRLCLDPRGHAREAHAERLRDPRGPAGRRPQGAPRRQGLPRGRGPRQPHRRVREGVQRRRPDAQWRLPGGE